MSCIVHTTAVINIINFIMLLIDFLLQAISLREMEDVASLEEKLGRSLSKQERSRIGVSSLRLFLEELLQKR